MARYLIAYATVDGQTRLIAEQLRLRLSQRGHDVTLHSLSDAAHAHPSVVAGAALADAFDAIVLGAAVRYGRHRPEAAAFVDQHRAALARVPCAFFSVNVVARKPGRDRVDSNPYPGLFLRATAWRPQAVAVFAGRIDYPRYGPLDRWLIRLIMRLTHGPTDPHGSFDFTDWARVDAFANTLDALPAAAQAPIPLRAPQSVAAD